jgi:hypothetical protein
MDRWQKLIRRESDVYSRPSISRKESSFNRNSETFSFHAVRWRPPILEEEFGKDWVDKVEKVTDKVLARWFFLPDLAYSVGILRKIDGYEQLKKKLFSIDEEFFAIISQMEFSAIMVEKVSQSNISLEGQFSMKNNKNPDLRVKINNRFHYFDITKVLDYRGLISVTLLQHTLSAFLEGFKEKR